MSGVGHSSPPPRATSILTDEDSLSTRFILFQELYVHMTGLYQVMKSSSDVSFPRHAPSPPASMQPEDMVSTSSFPNGNSDRNLSNNSLGDNVDQRHYILLLPPSDCFSEVATRVSSESGQLPTFAASVGSHTGHNGGGGFGGAARGASPSPSSPFFGSNSKANVNWRLKHNIVRSHVFQGSQWHKIVSRKLRNGGGGSSGSFTIPLTGLTGTQAEFQTTASNASTLLSKLRFNPGERSISSMAGGDNNKSGVDKEPLATISFSGAGSSLLPPGTASPQTTIQVLDVLQFGNLTIFFVDEAVGITTPKVSNGSLGRAPPSAQRAQSQLSCSQSPPLSPRTNIIGGSGSGLGSQVWWQRVSASASRALPTPPKTRRMSLEAPTKNGKPTLFAPFITDKIDQSVLMMFKKDERTLVTTFQEIAESRGVSTDEVMTAMDTETAIFNSSYVCMPGYEKFTVSKVEQMVDSAMDTFLDSVDRCVTATISTRPARKRVSGSLETPPGKNIPPPATPPPKLALAGALKSALKSASKGSKNKLDESEDEGSPRYRQATLDPNATHQSSSDDDNDSVSSCNVSRETLFSEDDEEQVYMVLHTVITSSLAKKLNAHWGTITPAEDYAFHHACLSLRRSLETTIMDFVPPACADTISISSFEKCFRLCKVVDSPDAGVFTCLRAMEATIASIVDVVNEHSTCKQDVTADVCIPLVVVVLIGACLMHFPSRLKLLLELMLPVVELSSLGYALTTFEASSEQIYYEYSLFVQNKADE